MDASIDVGVAASVIINGSILIVKEGRGKFKGLWGLPKGYVEPNESLEKAVLRELFEETGIIGEIEGIIAIRNKEIDGQVSIFICYKIIQLNEDIVIDGEEITDIKFVNIEDLDEIEWISLAMKHIVISSLKTKRALQHLDVSKSKNFSYTLSIPNDIEEFKLEVLR
jgi:8-oxo-dGTP diphosphatase